MYSIGLRSALMAAAATGLTEVNGAPPPAQSPMEAKLGALKGHVTGSVPLEMTEDKDEVCLTFEKAAFMAAVGPSKEGKSNGTMLTLNGKFEFDFNGRRYIMQAQFPRGAWVSVRAVDDFPIPAKPEAVKKVQ